MENYYIVKGRIHPCVFILFDMEHDLCMCSNIYLYIEVFLYIQWSMWLNYLFGLIFFAYWLVGCSVCSISWIVCHFGFISGKFRVDNLCVHLCYGSTPYSRGVNEAIGAGVTKWYTCKFWCTDQLYCRDIKRICTASIENMKFLLITCYQRQLYLAAIIVYLVLHVS